ncbi:flagellar hook-length control protein FliK [Paenibacillus castaneae]|uniref:flagellar hook-length control protein FliK n=1 Tax=Paenibacillus castaneae TaxID=474957 RepID=UPI001FBA30B4|nr:flagellar hook-length control protein FliK [Paenibacillus castaneae]
MIIPQVAPAQPATQSSAAGQGSKGATNAAFQQTLVQQINGDASAASGKSTPAIIVANINKQEATVAMDGKTVKSTMSELMSMIDGLIEQLDTIAVKEGDLKAEDDQQQQQLESALDQMTALLALLGLPVPVIQQMLVKPSIDEGNAANEGEAAALANVKSNLQNSLIQLQVLLQQGNIKHVQQQEPTLLVSQQLQALTAILQADSVDTVKTETKSTAAQQLFNQQAAPQAEVSSLLQRLSQQTVHSAFQISSTGGNQLDLGSESASTEHEMVVPFQLGNNNAEAMRNLTPLVTSANPGITSFVMADEFAESMSGLIVQKFDVSTLNGVSEAKLMLFPEHLGQVDVRITMQNGLLTAIFQTDTAMAKDMLDNQMAQLRAALQAQGLSVDKLEVSQGQSAPQLSQQQQGQGSSQQHAAGRQFVNADDASIDSSFETDLAAQAAVQGLGFGRGINVKA